MHLKCQPQKLLTVAVNNRQITLLYLAPTQHHSFVRNLPPLFICLKFTFSFGGVFFTDNTANCEGSIAMASLKIDFLSLLFTVLFMKCVVKRSNNGSKSIRTLR